MAVAAGVTLWSRTPNEAVATESQPAAVSLAARDAEPAPGVPAARSLDLAALAPPAAAAAALALEPSRPSAAPAPVGRRLDNGIVGTGAGAKARSRSKDKAVQKRKIAPTSVAAQGPSELCASSNFFMRPFCMRRLCGEPRFQARAECVPVRQAAHSQRD